MTRDWIAAGLTALAALAAIVISVWTMVATPWGAPAPLEFDRSESSQGYEAMPQCVSETSRRVKQSQQAFCMNFCADRLTQPVLTGDQVTTERLDLSCRELVDATFSGEVFLRPDFRCASITDSVFDLRTVFHGKFSHSQIQSSSFSGDIVASDFSCAVIRETSFADTTIDQTSFRGARIEGGSMANSSLARTTSIAHAVFAPDEFPREVTLEFDEDLATLLVADIRVVEENGKSVLTLPAPQSFDAASKPLRVLDELLVDAGLSNKELQFRLGELRYLWWQSNLGNSPWSYLVHPVRSVWFAVTANGTNGLVAVAHLFGLWGLATFGFTASLLVQRASNKRGVYWTADGKAETRSIPVLFQWAAIAAAHGVLANLLVRLFSMRPILLQDLLDRISKVRFRGLDRVAVLVLDLASLFLLAAALSGPTVGFVKWLSSLSG